MNVAEGTLNHSAEVLQTIIPIASKVEQWASNLSNDEYSTAAYEQAIVTAGKAGIKGFWITCTHMSELIFDRTLDAAT